MKIRQTVHHAFRFLPAILMLVSTLAAQGAEADRPRVGLVLGGGGARGAAHIGVLRELERNRVPIDVIAGTSMGAVIGGLYASGMSVDELEHLVATLDWAEVLSDSPPRNNLSFRRKQDDADYPIDLELGIRGRKILLPRGLIQGQELDLVLRELTIDVADINNFDDLPIPFRAVASDVVHGEPVVIGEGDLAEAMRASMTVPGMLAPVQMGDRLLVDGGLVGNLPISVARELGVDIVIAVDVEFPLYSTEELGSALDVSEQMLTILIHNETLRQIATLGEQDILIRPALGTFGSADFGKIVEAIGPGAEAARALADRLQEISLGADEYAAHVAARSVPRSEPGTLDFVRVQHDGGLSNKVLESRIETRVGDAVNPEQLAQDANRLYGLNLYEQVGYRIVEEDGEKGVEFQARTKSWGPSTLKFSLALEEDFDGATAFNIGTRLTKAGLNPDGAEWRTDLQVGADPLLVSEVYQPLGAGSRFFLAPRIDMQQSSIRTYLDELSSARLRLSEAEGGLDLGTELGSWGELRIGAFRGYGRARAKGSDPVATEFDFNTGGVFAGFEIDTLDSAQFPSSGLRAGFRWRSSLPGMGADSRFDTLESHFAGYWGIGKNIFQLGIEYSTTRDADDVVQDYFPMGGFLHLSGFERGSISGPHAALGKLVYYRQIRESASGLLDMPVYVGGSIESGNVWQTRDEIDFGSTYVNGSAFVGLDTYVGPLYFAAGLAEGGHTNLYLFIGSPPR